MKINSYKIIKYVFYILCIVSLFLSITSKVNAQEFTPKSLTSEFGLSLSDFTKYGNFSGTQYYQFFKNGNVDWSEYSYLTGTYHTTTLGTNVVYTNDTTGITYHCSSTLGQWYDFTITYADGTQASIDADGDIKTLCSDLQQTGTIQTYQYLLSDQPQVQFFIVDGSMRSYMCETNETWFKCPIPSSVRGIQVQVSYSGASLNRSFNLFEQVILYKDINNAINSNIVSGNTQNHQDSINTQNKLNDINNTMNNSSIDSPSSSTSSWNNMNANNGTITNLLTLPIQLMLGYVNGMNSSCTPFNLGDLFGTNITLPCINVGNLIGSSIWGVIDVLFSGFMIFGIAKKLIKIFNDFTNMKSNQVDELYGGGA